ncbi:MAG: hypothetical protein COT81_05810 [Candidatus Buchananbacteria bacterium CG10_big_fil_rev_8_21_14_0_10_42_9]|uniref:Uncharacterized protein n=1 Tax=Candidatus Buchananbacteria bacterium CG10_big_fil_rev_8_21_14_0_10_42_9 TaxID=1974526 RepID=A0A2H0VZR2_9BACT|nr:MAG: hypothetical protein COT81_05810 [Candidatus Buchananbacteria bacterium CG10_big_fil_rev_8_21_14_0_10_42_9]
MDKKPEGGHAEQEEGITTIAIGFDQIQNLRELRKQALEKYKGTEKGSALNFRMNDFARQIEEAVPDAGKSKAFQILCGSTGTLEDPNYEDTDFSGWCSVRDFFEQIDEVLKNTSLQEERSRAMAEMLSDNKEDKGEQDS